jgi:hypothetical protein
MSDPIQPIGPGLPLVPPGGLEPVKRLERVTRERDRPAEREWEEQEARRRGPEYKRSARVEGVEEEDDGKPHVDVRA